MNIYDELKWRGLVNQVSDEDKVREYLATPGRVMYCGFDPTAESLHVGNLVPLLCLARMRRAGHRPLFLLGGATGLIGDPSGKDKEREFSNQERIFAQADKIAAQADDFFRKTTGEPAETVNNYDWTRDLTAIELLREVGKHFTINWMLAKDSVKNRIVREDSGISYTEFSYMILQGYDFYRLSVDRDCRLQIGGSDQWGNITAGCELIRRKGGNESYALTFPLITTASGKKFGKSEKGAIFLSPEKTSPYTFYQFWINTDDSDVIRFLMYFTFLGLEDIQSLERELAEAPHLRAAQRRLAEETTRMIHGQAELDKVLAATAALFGKDADLRVLDAATLAAALESAPTKAYPADGLPDLPQVLVDLALSPSKGQARKDFAAGAVSLNGQKLADPAYVPVPADFIGGQIMVLRKGKKNYGVVRQG